MEKKALDLFNTNLFKENEVKALTTLANFFNYYNAELFMVGGGVRDALLNKTPKDIDLCTNATPDQVKQIIDDIGCFKYWDSGIKHGTLTLTSKDYKVSFEITTFRNETEADYSDHRHIENITFSQTLEEDLKRRDLTINSFAYDILNKELNMLDTSYLQDLEFGIIRAVGDPKERFKEDALRMLRTLRFSAQLNFSIALDTYNAIKDCAELISYISKERINDEITKILLSDNPQVLELFAITGLEKYAFGFTPISDILNCPHENPWHYTDVFHHTMDVIKRVPKIFELRWAALFHDFGKPFTKALKEGTVNHYNYHGHPDVSAEIALRLMEELKFSNEQKDLIYKYVKYHDSELIDCKNAKFKNILVDIGKEHFTDFIKLKFADASAHCLAMSTKYAIDYIDKLYIRYNAVVDNCDALTVKDLAVNGYDMINLGLSGKQIGETLNNLLEHVLEVPEDNNKEFLINFVKSNCIIK